jgi:hypothetical protein
LEQCFNYYSVRFCHGYDRNNLCYTKCRKESHILRPSSLVSIFCMHLRVVGDDGSYSKQDSCSNIFEASSITTKYHHHHHVRVRGHTFVRSFNAAYYSLQQSFLIACCSCLFHRKVGLPHFHDLHYKQRSSHP